MMSWMETEWGQPDGVEVVLDRRELGGGGEAGCVDDLCDGADAPAMEKRINMNYFKGGEGGWDPRVRA